MAKVACAVVVVIGGGFAGVAFAEHIAGYSFGHTTIEDKVFAFKFAFQSLLLDLVLVVNDASVELVDIGKSFVFEECACLFAANTACAVEEHFFVFFVCECFDNFFKFVAKCLCNGRDGVFEFANIAFVFVAHVNDDCAFFDFFVECFCVEVCADVSNVVGACGEVIGDDLFAYLEGQFPEGRCRFFERKLKGNACELGNAFEVCAEGVELWVRHADLCINAFVGKVNTSEYAKIAPCCEEGVAELLGIADVYVAIKRKRLSGKGFLCDFCFCFGGAEIIAKGVHIGSILCDFEKKRKCYTARCMRRYVEKHFLTFRVFPLVVVAVAVKSALFFFNFSFFELNGYFSTLVAANVFLLGFLISGVLPDYKESEKLPADIAASLDVLFDECRALYLDKKVREARDIILHTRELSLMLDRWFHERLSTSEVMKNIRAYAELFTALEPHTQANFLVRLKQEVSSMRRMILRIRNIRTIHFTGTAYAVAELFTILVVCSVLVVEAGSFIESLFITGLITYVLAYMLFLIRDLDNPFDYTRNSHLSDEIALAPLGVVARHMQEFLKRGRKK